MNSTFISFDIARGMWQDTPEMHTRIFKEFFDNVNADPELKAHRDFVEQHEFGYGDRPFHWMWNLIVPWLPQGFKFLEIGVYQGQVISLVSMLNKRYGKQGEVFGLTPLAPVNDAFSKHHDVDYEQRIATLYAQFVGSAEDLILIQGLSGDPVAIQNAERYGPYDCIYIDGGHDYKTVTKDILTYAPMVKPGGLLVMDDSANYLNIPNGLIRMNWKGILDVSNAVADHLETDPEFEHIFSVGHNRVWIKNANNEDRV